MEGTCVRVQPKGWYARIPMRAETLLKSCTVKQGLYGDPPVLGSRLYTGSSTTLMWPLEGPYNVSSSPPLRINESRTTRMTRDECALRLHLWQPQYFKNYYKLTKNKSLAVAGKLDLATRNFFFSSSKKIFVYYKISWSNSLQELVRGVAHRLGF